MKLSAGKLRADILDRMLTKYISLDERVKVGPAIGEDAAAVDMGYRYLLCMADFISFGNRSSQSFRWILVIIDFL